MKNDTTMFRSTAARPSGSAMPTSAYPAAMSGAPVEAIRGMAYGAVCTATTAVTKQRFVVGDAVTGGAFPGTPAWSPPTS